MDTVIDRREIQRVIEKAKQYEGGDTRHPRARLGKTFRDERAGTLARNADNKLARAEWDKDPMRTGANHPTHTCNGHRYYRGGSDSRTSKIKFPFPVLMLNFPNLKWCCP